MSIGRWVGGCIVVAAVASIGTSGAAVPAAGILANGDFSKTASSAQLRKAKQGDWYESRKDGHGAKRLLLSKKTVAGDATAKAMIRGSKKANTYLTQAFASPQTGDFVLRCDILVKKIAAPPNHSAFLMVGNDADKKGGPNSTAAERFVFVGFENAAEKGKLNLFAREAGAGWDKETVVAKGLDLGKWTTIEIAVHPSQGTYDVSVGTATPRPVTVKAFAPAGPSPAGLTAVSFASWNDGPGTFYVDNVSATPR